jgi:hypothetical protein
MDLNSILESGTALWTAIGGVGGLVIINVLTFIKTSVSGKKFTKVSDFAVVADQSIKFAKSEITSAKEQIVEETKKLIVEPLKEQVQALVSDNAQLSSIVVSLLSYIPLPLEVKKDAVAVIGTLGNITNGAKALLDSSITYQESQVAIEKTQDTELQDNIDKI